MKHIASLVALGLLASGSGRAIQEKEYYESGKLKAEFTVDAEGRKHGRYIEYYESGKKKVSANFTAGQLHGEWWEYHENGRPFGKKGFDKGSPRGDILRMDPNGIILYRAVMTPGGPQFYRDFKKPEPAYPRSLEEIRKQIETIDPPDKRLDVAESGKFDIEPSASAPHRAGKLKAAYLQDALKHFNVYRYLSGLNHGVKLDDKYNDECQHAAVVLAAIGKLSHTPAKPDDMDGAFHAKGYKGTTSSNLHRGRSFLREAIDGWMEDSGENNLKHAGHRAWCQNPEMGRIGFGEFDGYFAQWAHDRSGRADSPDLIGYPVPGYQPLEYFGTHGPWSISPKDSRFKVPAQADLGVRIWLLDEGCDFSQELKINSKSVPSQYGSGTRAVFRPTLPEDLNLEGRRVWILITRSGTPQFGYFVHFVSLAAPEAEPPAETSERRR